MSIIFESGGEDSLVTVTHPSVRFNEDIQETKIDLTTDPNFLVFLLGATTSLPSIVESIVFTTEDPFVDLEQEGLAEVKVFIASLNLPVEVDLSAVLLEVLRAVAQGQFTITYTRS